MSVNFTTNDVTNTPVSGLGAGDTINKLLIAWILAGTDNSGRTDFTVYNNLANSASAAVAAGRAKLLIAGTDDAAIAAVQTTAGATFSDIVLQDGATYIPAFQWTENKSGGGMQSGNWTYGAAVTNGTSTTTATPTTPAPTTPAPTTAQPTTTAPPTTDTFDGSNGAAPSNIWTVNTSGGGTATLDGAGKCVIDVSGAVTKAAVITRTAAVPKSGKTYEFVLGEAALTDATLGTGTQRVMLHSTSNPVGTNSVYNGLMIMDVRLRNETTIGDCISIVRRNASGGFEAWMGSSWGATDTYYTGDVASTLYGVRVILTATQVQMQVWDSTFTTKHLDTGLTLFTDLGNASGSLYLSVGEPLTDYDQGTCKVANYREF